MSSFDRGLIRLQSWLMAKTKLLCELDTAFAELRSEMTESLYERAATQMLRERARMGPKIVPIFANRLQNSRADESAY
jgi:hypothetical protein